MLPQFSVRKPYTVLDGGSAGACAGRYLVYGHDDRPFAGHGAAVCRGNDNVSRASPEKIETTVTKPLEAVLGTTGGH